MVDILGLHFNGPGSKRWDIIIEEVSIHILVSTIGLIFVLISFVTLDLHYNIVSGFAIFGFFPFWLRLFIDAYITSLILCIPFSVYFIFVFLNEYHPDVGEKVTEVEGKYVLMNLSNGYVGKFIRLPNEFEGKAGASYKVKYK